MHYLILCLKNDIRIATTTERQALAAHAVLGLGGERGKASIQRTCMDLVSCTGSFSSQKVTLLNSKTRLPSKKRQLHHHQSSWSPQS